MGFHTLVELVILDMDNIYILFGMTWCSRYHVLLNGNTKSIALEIHGRERLEIEWVYKIK